MSGQPPDWWYRYHGLSPDASARQVRTSSQGQYPSRRDNDEDETVEIEGRKVRQTEKAILWDATTGDETWWPLSKVEQIDADTLSVPLWLAKKNGYE